MASHIDSQANFEARALAVGIAPEVVARAIAADVVSLASYAFASTYQPGGQDDTPLRDLVTPWLGLGAGAVATAAQLAPFRRLHFEAHALSLSEIKSRTEAPDEVARQVPLAERSARHTRQQAKLAGIDLIGEFEASHSLLDAAQQMWDTNVASYVGIEKCIKRSDELAGQRRVTFLTVDSKGAAKLEHTTNDLAIDMSRASQMTVYYAMHRRALALDQVDLISYGASRKWIEELFEHLRRQPPPSFAPVSASQLIEAERELWSRLAELTRMGIRSTAGTRPLEVAFATAKHLPSVAFALLPRPLSSVRRHLNDSSLLESEHSWSRAQSPPPSAKRTEAPGGLQTPKKSKKARREAAQAAKSAEKAKEKPTAGKMTFAYLKGLQQRDREGVQLCYNFNLGKPCQSDCARRHACMKCLGGHPAHGCVGSPPGQFQ